VTDVISRYCRNKGLKMDTDEFLDKEYKKYLKWLEKQGEITIIDGRVIMSQYAEGATDGWDLCQQTIIQFLKESS